MKGGAKVIVEAHRHEGVFIARGKEDALVTLNSTPGKDVYGEKRIQVDGPPGPDGEFFILVLCVMDIDVHFEDLSLF